MVLYVRQKWIEEEEEELKLLGEKLCESVLVNDDDDVWVLREEMLRIHWTIRLGRHIISFDFSTCVQNWNLITHLFSFSSHSCQYFLSHSDTLSLPNGESYGRTILRRVSFTRYFSYGNHQKKLRRWIGNTFYNSWCKNFCLLTPFSRNFWNWRRRKVIVQ